MHGCLGLMHAMALHDVGWQVVLALISQHVHPTTSPATLLSLVKNMGEAVARATGLHQTLCGRQKTQLTEEARKGLPAFNRIAALRLRCKCSLPSSKPAVHLATDCNPFFTRH